MILHSVQQSTIVFWDAIMYYTKRLLTLRCNRMVYLRQGEVTQRLHFVQQMKLRNTSELPLGPRFHCLGLLETKGDNSEITLCTTDQEMWAGRVYSLAVVSCLSWVWRLVMDPVSWLRWGTYNKQQPITNTCTNPPEFTLLCYRNF